MGAYIEKLEKFERAAELYLKKYKYTEIARELNITPVHAKALVEEYKTLIKDRAQQDPEILDRVVENTLEVLESMNMIAREAWETYSKAKEYEMIQQQNAGLKNLMDVEERRARLLQLMGAKTDGGNIERLRKAERVNEIVSYIIKEIIADCPRCRVEAQIHLARAFEEMDKEEEVSKMREIESTSEVIDVESQEDALEAQLAHENMMGDILGDG